MSKWTKDIVTFNEEEDEDVSRGGRTSNVTRTWCFTGTHATVRFTKETFVTKRLPREACFDLGDVKVDETHHDFQ